MIFNNSTAWGLFRQAKNKLKDNDLDSAKELFERAITFENQSHEISLGTTIALFELGNIYSKLQSELQSTISTYPNQIPPELFETYKNVIIELYEYYYAAVNRYNTILFNIINELLSFETSPDCVRMFSLRGKLAKIFHHIRYAHDYINDFLVAKNTLKNEFGQYETAVNRGIKIKEDKISMDTLTDALKSVESNISELLNATNNEFGTYKEFKQDQDNAIAKAKILEDLKKEVLYCLKIMRLSIRIQDSFQKILFNQSNNFCDIDIHCSKISFAEKIIIPFFGQCKNALTEFGKGKNEKPDLLHIFIQRSNIISNQEATRHFILALEIETQTNKQFYFEAAEALIEKYILLQDFSNAVKMNRQIILEYERLTDTDNLTIIGDRYLIQAFQRHKVLLLNENQNTLNEASLREIIDNYKILCFYYFITRTQCDSKPSREIRLVYLQSYNELIILLVGSKLTKSNARKIVSMNTDFSNQLLVYFNASQTLDLQIILANAVNTLARTISMQSSPKEALVNSAWNIFIKLALFEMKEMIFDSAITCYTNAMVLLGNLLPTSMRIAMKIRLAEAMFLLNGYDGCDSVITEFSKQIELGLKFPITYVWLGLFQLKKLVVKIDETCPDKSERNIRINEIFGAISNIIHGINLFKNSLSSGAESNKVGILNVITPENEDLARIDLVTAQIHTQLQQVIIFFETIKNTSEKLRKDFLEQYTKLSTLELRGDSLPDNKQSSSKMQLDLGKTTFEDSAYFADICFLYFAALNDFILNINDEFAKKIIQMKELVDAEKTKRLIRIFNPWVVKTQIGFNSLKLPEMINALIFTKFLELAGKNIETLKIEGNTADDDEQKKEDPKSTTENAPDIMPEQSASNSSTESCSVKQVQTLASSETIKEMVAPKSPPKRPPPPAPSKNHRQSVCIATNVEKQHSNYSNSFTRHQNARKSMAVTPQTFTPSSSKPPSNTSPNPYGRVASIKSKLESNQQSTGNGFFSKKSGPETLIKNILKATSTDGSILQFKIVKVDRDGNCGYTAFGVNRDTAYGKLLTYIQKSTSRIQIVVQEALLQEPFRCYLLRIKSGGGFLQNVLLDNSDSNIQALSLHPEIVSAYIDFDVKERKIDGGWSHPAILFALADIFCIELHIWEKGPEGSVIPFSRQDGMYAEFKPTNQIVKRVDLIFVNGNHFDRLEMLEQPKITNKLSV